MAHLGMNVSRTGSHDPDELAAVGVRFVRLVAMADVDLRPYIEHCHAVGIGVMPVIARESLANDTLSFEDAAQLYAGRYAGLIDALQVGNEPDGAHAPPSWTMSIPELNHLLGAFRAAFPSTFLVGPGLVSGDAGKASGLDVSLVDALSVHPYGQGAPGFPSPYGFPGHVGMLIHTYALMGRPVWISEWGVRTSDFRPEEQGTAHDYMRAMLTHLRDRSDVFAAFYFTWKDPHEPGLALFEADGTPKPGLEILRQVALQPAPARLEPILPAATVPFEPVPVGADTRP